MENLVSKTTRKESVKPPHHILIAAAVNAALALLPAHAQTTSSHERHLVPVGAKASDAAKVDMTEGEVRKVDKSKKTITLKHGPIKNLDMPPMTMVFDAADASLLNKVKAGDRVRFVAANPGGKLTVTEIQPAQ
jgi:Cu(I)/Ag(I) efflux system periplasmic protein CusF